MKARWLIVLTIASLSVKAQVSPDSARAEIIKLQEDLNREYADPARSPLGRRAAKKFKSHSFFPIDLSYRVVAKLIPTPENVFIDFQTTTTKILSFRIYGYLVFELQGRSFTLPVWQPESKGTSGYGDYLFFPFLDRTSRTSTYSGGRYIDLRIPKNGDEVILDFNKSYNPNGAYNNNKYSSPYVPRENFMEILVQAGTKFAVNLNKEPALASR